MTPRGVMEHTFIIGFDQADLTPLAPGSNMKFENDLREKVNA